MNTADRKFTYESINEYYTTKLSKIGVSGDLLLDDDETIGKFNMKGLVEYFKGCARSYDLILPDFNTKPYTWLELINNTKNDDNKIKLLKFRDFVFCTIMVWIGSHMPISDDDALHKLPSGFDISKNMFTVIGSQSFISDIDVTIQGPHAWVIIANLEDLYVYLFTPFFI